MTLHRMPRKGERIHFPASTRQGPALDLIVHHVSERGIVWCQHAGRPFAGIGAPCFIGAFADGTFNTDAVNLDECQGTPLCHGDASGEHVPACPLHVSTPGGPLAYRKAGQS